MTDTDTKRDSAAMSRATAEVLARLPKEPGMAIMADLLDDLAPTMAVTKGVGMILTALKRIRTRFGLFEGQCDNVPGYGIPETSWEQAQYAAAEYLEAHGL